MGFYCRLEESETGFCIRTEFYNFNGYSVVDNLNVLHVYDDTGRRMYVIPITSRDKVKSTDFHSK